MKKKNLIILLTVLGILLVLAGIGVAYLRNQQARQNCTSYLNSAGQEIFKDCVQ